MIGPELHGEDFSEATWKSEHEQKRKLGRPRKINPESLSRAVKELQFVLEMNWGIVGWLLLQAKTLSDVRNAFAKIVTQNCGYLEPFRYEQSRKTTPSELRALRKRVAELEERHTRDFVRWQSAREALDRASDVRATDHIPVIRGQIQTIFYDLAFKSQEAQSLEQASRMDFESFRTQLKESEAHFAQTEILRFIESNRRQFSPLSVARAMAGIPHVTARVSCELCTKYEIKLSHGIEFEMFRAIERILQVQMCDPGRSIDGMREHLLNSLKSDLPYATQLRKNWHFLEMAIRSAAHDTTAQPASLAFRIFADYSRTSRSHSGVDAVLAGANRLLKDGDDPELERGPYWRTPQQSHTRRGASPKK